MWNIEIENAICKARGILNNVMDAHEDPRHEHMTAALWAVDGLLAGAMKDYEGGLKNETSPYNDAEFKAELDDLFSQRRYEEPCGLYDSDEEAAEEEADEEEDFEDSPSFSVEMVEEHEDGSATFQVSGSEKSMKQLFEAFFCQAVINGVRFTKEKNDKYCAERRALEVARDFETLVRMWEDSAALDYDPTVKSKREELAKALSEAGI